jgi:hypothetical protein
MKDTYRGWTIHYDPPPIPIRNFDWQAYGPNYDASWKAKRTATLITVKRPPPAHAKI